MATLDTDEANLIDQESVNWKLIVFPVVAVIIIGIAVAGIYYYQIVQRDQLEDTARAALVAAKTPEDMIKVADQYPASTQATLALLQAASDYFAKNDYANALSAYQKVDTLPHADETLAESARLGVASSLEASGKVDDAIAAYVREGDIGAKSPYAPYAYFAAAQIYEQKGDKVNERRILTEAAALDPDSVFVRQAQNKLKQMASEEQPVTPASAPNTVIPSNTAPAAAIPPTPAANAPAVTPPHTVPLPATLPQPASK
jgi:predicted negative regulator of RcsB-dependent stress response